MMGGEIMLKIYVCADDGSLLDHTVSINSLPFGHGEAQRLTKMKNESARRLSLLAWSTLHTLISDCGYDSDADLNVLRTSERKPYFESLPLHFNLTHTSGAVSAAISDSPVGIDLEWLDSSRDIEAIASRFFSPDEQSAISSSNDRQLAFFSLWTKKEAYAKSLGKGLADICSGGFNNSAYFSQYIIEYGENRGILSVCCSSVDQISICDTSGMLKIYEYNKSVQA